MASLGIAFNPAEVPESDNDFELVKPGTYVAEIVENEVKATKAGTGHYLKLTWQIKQGEYENRKVWQQINFDNPNPQARTIGMKEINAIYKAAGFTGPVGDLNADDFMGKLYTVSIGVKKDESGVYGDKNVVKGVKAYGVVAAPAAAKPAQASNVSAFPQRGAAGAITRLNTPAAPGAPAAPWARS